MIVYTVYMTPPTHIQTIGDRIRYLRKVRNLTWSALAGAAGLTPDGLYRIVRGTTKNPGFVVLCGLATALGVTLDQLAGRTQLTDCTP